MEKDIDSRHKARMARKKAVVDDHIAAAQIERGVVLINTGNGKGKSSAAFGVLARALGHGQQAAVVQFVKSRTDTGEEALFSRLPGVRWHVMGEGFTWETQDRHRDTVAARAAWDLACQYLKDTDIRLLILDEITYAFKYGWLDLNDAIAALKARAPMQHVILTGRGAPQGLIDVADTVSEINDIKHAYQAGVKAMPGLDF
ncbi:MAG: cob(I)yrinic acid a,c-diamide adenosyltransferase [Rhodocyclaceae bacterium]|nr:MAG: cob(I)yrinic acid a,c-diamide adenosyltransferase [Rhodocyclaceae bacterium]